MWRLFLGDPTLPPSCRWGSRAAAVSRAELEVQLGPGLTVFGLEAQVGLASRAPDMGEGVKEEPKLSKIGVKHHKIFLKLGQMCARMSWWD